MASSQNKFNYYIPHLMLALFIGISWWAYTQLESRMEETDLGFQGEALTNDFLAAEYFLRRMGQSAEQMELFAQDNDMESDRKKQLKSNDTLLVAGNRVAFDKRRSTELMQWVEQGGHLIITAKAYQADDYINHDNLLETFNLYIQLQILDDDNEEDDEFNSEDQAEEAAGDEGEFWRVDFLDDQVIVFGEDFSQEILWTFSVDEKIHAVQLKVAEGKLTLLSDMDMFQNEFIDQYDNAAFLFELSNDQLKAGEPGVFYYSLYQDQLSLFDWLWINAPYLMLSLLITGFITLWKIIPRFGPLIHVHLPVRRHFIDHLSASGNYHWSKGHYAHLLEEVRKQLSIQIKLKYPEWINLNRQAQITHYVEISQLDSSRIEDALFTTQVERVDDFVNKIKVLEKLRKSL